MRKALSKKKRFGIFERDGFCCQYCGRDPINFDIILEVDHCISVKDGGWNSVDNLVTSCFNCNRWKSSKSVVVWNLTDVESEKQKLQKAMERLTQIKEIKKIRKKLEDLRAEEEEIIFGFIGDITNWYSERLQRKMNMIIKWKYNKWVDINVLEECLKITDKKFMDHEEFYIDDYAKYFYWVLRNRTE